MKHKILLLLCIVLNISYSFSQGEANIWYFGANAGLDFNSGTPVWRHAHTTWRKANFKTLTVLYAVRMKACKKACIWKRAHAWKRASMKSVQKAHGSVQKARGAWNHSARQAKDQRGQAGLPVGLLGPWPRTRSCDEFLRGRFRLDPSKSILRVGYFLPS